MLHGIYGRGRNWASIARDLASRRPDWACALLDLRLHGDSPGFSPPHTVATAASDVALYEEETGFHASSVLGHSFGGKVALAHAAFGRDRLVQVWVVDSTPEAREPSGSAWRLLDVVRALPPDFTSRREAAAGIEAAGYSSAVAAWMSSNLHHREGRYRWRLDLDGAETMLRDFFATDLWAIVENPPADAVLHFVKATASSVLSEEACVRIEEAGRRHGRAHLHRVAGGHWLHADNPRALVELLASTLPRASLTPRLRASDPRGAPARPAGSSG